MKLYSIETEIIEFKNKTLDLQDILYDLFGQPIIDYNLKDKISRQKLITDFKYYLDNNTPMLIINSSENDDESIFKKNIYPILSYFKINEEILTNFNKNTKKNELEENELSDYDPILDTILLKLMINFEKENELKTEYSHRVLLDGNKEYLADLLYPASKNSFTYICMIFLKKQ